MTRIVTTADTIPVITADPFSLENLTDPHPLYEQLREAGPVVYLERYNVWAMARYEQVNAALKDWGTFSSSSGAGLTNVKKETPWQVPGPLLEDDPPAHTYSREVVGPILAPPALRALRPAFEREAVSLVDRLLELGSFDAVTQLAKVYPLKVFADAMGLSKDGRENLLLHAHMVVNAFGPRNQLLEESLAKYASVREWVVASCKREALCPGGFGAQIWDAVDKGKIPEEWAPLLIRALLSAGIITVVSALSSILYALANDPKQWQMVRENPALIKPAFEEGVRWGSPGQLFFRTTTREVEIDGKRIPQGEKVLLFLGAANRDPRRWTNPDRFDIHRNATGHVGFGMGIHRCVGLTFARMEAEILLTVLAQRVARIEISGQPQREPTNTVFAWRSIPVTVHPAFP